MKRQVVTLIAAIALVATGPNLVHAATATDHLKHDDHLTKEHEEVLKLLKTQDATATASRSGSWESPETWGGKPPKQNAKVVIKNGVIVTLSSKTPSLHWVRLEGTLRFGSKDDPTLRLTTLLVTPTGVLEIGTFRRPIPLRVTAKVQFLPRTSEDIETDPTDSLGGLLSLGRVQIHGAAKTPFALSRTPLKKGTESILFPNPATNWKVGDRIVIAGVAPPDSKTGDTQDEIRKITSISPDHKSISFGALKYDHLGPGNITLPVSNLERNVEVSSRETSPLRNRGHVMFMKRQTGITIFGAAFRGLGRTTAARTHTYPTESGFNDSNRNTVGRYALHFHLRSGASSSLKPNLVTNSVIEDAPKHGLVNHGGNVVATGNVTLDIAGSHFFAENGTELGAFKNNVAIHSKGSGELIRAREFIGDLGHGGHGFWTQSGAVTMSGNYAFGHAGSGFVVFGYPQREGGEYAYFDSRNLNGQSNQPRENLPISNIAFVMKNNVAAGTQYATEVWVRHIYSKEYERSLIDGLVGWNISQVGVFLPYSKNIDIRRLNLWNSDGAGVGMSGNQMTESVTITDATIHGFTYAISAPGRGRNIFSNIHAEANEGVTIASPGGPNRVVEIADLTYSGPGKAVRFFPYAVQLNGDLAMLFENDRIFLHADTKKRQLYFPEQRATHVPFLKSGPKKLQGMTNDEIRSSFGLIMGGGLVPDTSKSSPESNGLDGPLLADVVTYETPTQNSEFSYAVSLEPQYPGVSTHFSREKGANGWNIVTRGDGTKAIAFVDNEPPTFVLNPYLEPLSIHPDDVKHGFRIEGMLFDAVGSEVSMRAFTQDFLDLTVKDGVVTIPFSVHDLSENERRLILNLKVTKSAKKRGSNLSWFTQAQFCGKCSTDTSWFVEARKSFSRERSLAIGS